MAQTKPKARGRKPGKRLTAFKTALVAVSMGLTMGTWGILTSPNVQAMQAVVDDGGGQVAITAPASPTAALATPISTATATAPATATAQSTTTAPATATAQPTATAAATAKTTTAPAPVARTRSSK